MCSCTIRARTSRVRCSDFSPYFLDFDFDFDVDFDFQISISLESGVTIQNVTTIRYSKIATGVKNALCLSNTTQSATVTVPYLSKLNFDTNPKKFNVSTPFNATCNVNFVPSINDYAVEYWVNSSLLIGTWKVAGEFFYTFEHQKIS